METNILKKTTVLVAEDDQNIRIKLVKILETYVAKIYESQNGEEALELFHQHSPNIIITDYKMPVMDGLELITNIRKENSFVPIVVISAYSDQKTLLNFMSLNLVEFVIKPISFEQLDKIMQISAKKLIKHGLIETFLSDNIMYSFSKKAVIKDNNIVDLTPIEIRFLELLINNKEKLITFDTIYHCVYDGEFATMAAINNLVSKLRRKIGVNIIKNISKIGYILHIDYQKND
jgi:DNA-binding response OmpR family regulator